MFAAIKRRFLTVAVVVVSVLGLGGAAAYATGLFGQDSMINACVNNVTGLVRIVQHAGACSSSEHALSWAQGSAPQSPPPVMLGRSAYAHFSGGALDTSRSSGISSWSRDWQSGEAFYCIDVQFTPTNVTASNGLYTSPSITSSVSLLNSAMPWFALQGERAMQGTPCRLGTSAVARVAESESGNFADFYVTLTR